MRNNKITKIILMTIIFSIFISTFYFEASATETKYEVEYNNEYAYAESTADDWTNREKITYTDDIDCWNISFDTSGMANFYLGSIPSGCDYELEIYKSNGTQLLAASTTSGNELIRCHVYAGTVYTAKTYSSNGINGDSYYKFRAKVYTLSDAKFFTFNYDEVENGVTVNIDSQTMATNSIPYCWNMGFSSTNYLNNSVSAAYSVLANCDIFVVMNHGNKGFVRFNKTTTDKNRLYAKDGTFVGTNDRAIGATETPDLSEVELIIFGSCYSGGTDSTYGNLVVEALNAGARCSFGFYGEINRAASNYWFTRFFKYCRDGYEINGIKEYSVSAAVEGAKADTSQAYPTYATDLASINFGSSSPGTLVIGGNY